MTDPTNSRHSRRDLRVVLVHEALLHRRRTHPDERRTLGKTLTGVATRRTTAGARAATHGLITGCAGPCTALTDNSIEIPHFLNDCRYMWPII